MFRPRGGAAAPAPTPQPDEQVDQGRQGGHQHVDGDHLVCLRAGSENPGLQARGPGPNSSALPEACGTAVPGLWQRAERELCPGLPWGLAGKGTFVGFECGDSVSAGTMAESACKMGRASVPAPSALPFHPLSPRRPAAMQPPLLPRFSVVIPQLQQCNVRAELLRNQSGAISSTQKQVPVAECLLARVTGHAPQFLPRQASSVGVLW